MDWQALSDRLKAMGMQLGKDQLLQPIQKLSYPIETVVPGTFEETIHGQAFCLNEVYTYDYTHGNAQLLPTQSLAILAHWARAPHIHNEQLHNIVFLDTETTGLSGGTGTMAFMVGVGRYTADGFMLAQYFMRHPGEEPAFLAALTRFLDPLDAVVTYNGKAFDIPMLNTRYILQGFTTPFMEVAHFDLLALARRLWRDRLESCTLGNIEHEILGVSRNEEEVPGYLIPEMYGDYLRSGDARPMKGIFYHNAIDILSLAALFAHTADLLAVPLERPEHNGIDLAAIGKLFQALGYDDIATAIFEESIQRELPLDIFCKTLMHFAGIYKRQGNYPSATVLWEKAAQIGQPEACEELAKYYEHYARDYAQAISWTQKGMELTVLDREWQERLVYRMERLERKKNQSLKN